MTEHCCKPWRLTWVCFTPLPKSLLLWLPLIKHDLTQSKRPCCLWYPCLGHQNTKSPFLKILTSPPKNFTLGHPVTYLSRFKDWQLTQEGCLLDETQCLPQSMGHMDSLSLVLCWYHSSRIDFRIIGLWSLKGSYKWYSTTLSGV